MSVTFYGADPLDIHDQLACEVDRNFFWVILRRLVLYDLVDVDRELIRDVMDTELIQWAEVVGDELARLTDRRQIENGLCELVEVE